MSANIVVIEAYKTKEGRDILREVLGRSEMLVN